MSFLRPPARCNAAPGVSGLRILLVNVFFLSAREGSRDWGLVDAGLRGSGPAILREAERLFGRGVPPRAIVLTHGHFDHTGALPWLLRRWRTPVFAHPRELPFCNHGERYAPADPTVGGGIVPWLATLFPRTPTQIPFEVRLLPADGSVPGLPEWQWIHTPGHSPGHISLWRESDACLVAGDAVVSTRQESLFSVWRQSPELRPPPAYFTPDWPRAFDSMRTLRKLSPAVIASGHGQTLAGPVWLRHWDELIAHFGTRGLPRQGRYVPAQWATA